MMKFIKMQNRHNPHDISNVEIHLTADDYTLEEVFMTFKEFLLACGYIIDGDIGVNHEE